MATKELELPEAQALAVLEGGSPKELIKRATEAATELARIIETRRLWTEINGRKHTHAEGWQALAMLMGFIPREKEGSVRRLEDGAWEATVELVHIRTGQVLTSASSMCGGVNESDWQSRRDFQKRSMATTRAMGKVGRLAFSWIMTLAGYDATPAEEMTDDLRGSRNGNKVAAAQNGNEATDVAVLLREIEAATTVDQLTIIREERMTGLKGKDVVNVGGAWRGRLKEIAPELAKRD